MDDKECKCLKGNVCCKCGVLLEKDELMPGSNPFAADVWDDHSKHLICDNCTFILLDEI